MADISDIIKVEEIKFSDQSLEVIPSDKYISCKQALIYRLALQLRLDQQAQEKKIKDILSAEKIISDLLMNDIQVNHNLECITNYDLLAKHTFTYVPAIFASLKSKADQNPSLIQSIANSSIEFAIKVGLRLQGSACQLYMNLVKNARLLIENPLNFNKLNSLILSNLLLAVDIHQAKVQLKISANAKVLIGKAKVYDITNFNLEVVKVLQKHNKNKANKIYIHYLKT